MNFKNKMTNWKCLNEFCGIRVLQVSEFSSEFLLTYTENRTDAERCHKHLQCVYTDSD